MADNSNNRTTASSSDIHSCPICHDPFHGDHAAFENHVNSHFADEEQDDQHPPPLPPPLDQAPVLLIHPHKLQGDAVPLGHSELFDVPDVTSTIQDTEDDFKIPCEAQNCNMMGIAGLIAKTRMLLETSLAQGVTQQAYLADTSTMLFQSDKSDRGWGCGYRNIQMMLSYVVGQTDSIETTSTATTTTTPSVPTIPELQRQLEYAWTNGFDAQGAEQLKHKVEGTKKWIGTTEAWSVLCSLGVRCSILDFHMPSGPDGTHPAMFAAVYEYFGSPNWSPLSAPLSLHVDNSRLNGNEGQDRIIQTAKPPLYMQHQGHSRTIVGIEILKEDRGMNLLVFDPGRWLHNAIPTLRREVISQSISPSMGSKAIVAWDKKLDAQYLLKAFRLQVGSGVAKAQYQLLGWTEDEHEGSKSVTSTRVP
ncbi:hypothetical protein BGZ96_010680 [Linnemannia gamsii]|uniref:UFSP1/2/DUB catalytic domain-containing protein n=1 Tax=Linnemannia gamsii TaxID=64522 RepID=A0ABQ7JU79_9FUNG|nr:hypothetical protein BGZ96_010680 [Linnemannia gamsii]